VGGVDIFVNNTWECSKIDEYNVMKYNDVTAENVLVQITKQLKNITLKYIVGGINRYSNGNIDLFTNVLECNLCKFRQSNTAGIIAGEINTDLIVNTMNTCVQIIM